MINVNIYRFWLTNLAKKTGKSFNPISKCVSFL